MAEWKAPEVEKLDVKNTASSGGPGATERDGGFSTGYWQDATFDSNIYEKSDNTSTYCVVPKKDSAGTNDVKTGGDESY